MLRRSRKPVVLVVNKVDNFDRQMMDVYEFYNLGIGEPHAISASGKLGIGDMLDEVTGYFDPEMENEEESEIPRIAIVGKPNVGNPPGQQTAGLEPCHRIRYRRNDARCDRYHDHAQWK